MESTVCIIPARGGSKRIPRKNIKNFLGKPIIAYSIEAAKESGLFQEIMVSTDDEEIASIAQHYGAKVPFMRSAKNADDHATTMDVIQEVTVMYKQFGRKFDYICCIYPTAPLISPKHLAQGFNQLITKNLDAVFPVSAFSYPIWRGLKKTDNGKVEMLFPEYVNTRSQDLPTIYHDAGQWYWINVESFGTKKSLFSGNTGMLLLEGINVQDIDCEEDWKLAEIKYEYLQSSK
ncbi:MAG: pseudaminic acid cytidylyltransferase [Saprospiraceae bacterium]|nr:pseudaminic acid cytidylyltransferase [Saprospiraceae bacterium]